VVKNTLEKSLLDAAKSFADGGIIAYPTEAVFGLGCDPDNEQAIIRLLAIKQRSADKGLILLASDYYQLQPFIDEQNFSQNKLGEVKSRWPAALTQIMPAKKSISTLLTGGRNTIAVRITQHPEVIDLCRLTKKAIISTSANLSGQATAHSWQQVENQFANKIDYLLKGKTLGLLQPTTIIDALTGKVLRA
jgi:L-threonylcarbamoyladenylate synthase